MSLEIMSAIWLGASITTSSVLLTEVRTPQHLLGRSKIERRLIVRILVFLPGHQHRLNIILREGMDVPGSTNGLLAEFQDPSVDILQLF